MFKICKHQFLLALISPRIYIALFIGCVMQIISSMPLLEFSQLLDKPLGIFESLIYFNCDTFTASSTFLGVILLVSDIPFSSENETYTLMRVSRTNWVLGKFIYLFCICLFYYFVVTVAGMLFISENAYMGNFWSEPIYLLVKDNNMNFAANYNVYFPYSHILLGLTPLKAFISSYLLSVSYAFTMSLLIFWLNLEISFVLSYIPVIMLHIIGYLIAALLKSYFYMRFSLLGNSLLMYHNTDRRASVFPTLSESFLIFFILCVLLSFLILKGIKKYDFRITVGTKL